ncbi:translational initiation factor [Blastococcus sp. KM273128]|uniref:muconolactone Delta-isomerase family protein n=1 Tax=Blastococcus sp. KM273128 TaxID=2570314 RepID=UPI001F364B25|nr:muconolactone Delta-isomerase family protein [Blastococcus sp. KM273128]MCF6743490.1 translational initiation factor [Blastococcus sp. KM273128]
MLFHLSFRVDHTRLDRDEFWDEWEREVRAAVGAMEAGLIKSLYKVAGQRRVIGIVDVESHDQLDQVVMGALPMSHYLTLEEVLPVREYTAFAEDVQRRWQS